MMYAKIAWALVRKNWKIVALILVISSGYALVTIKNIKIKDLTIDLLQRDQSLAELRASLSDQNAAVEKLEKLNKKLQDKYKNTEQEVKRFREQSDATTLEYLQRDVPETCEGAMGWLVNESQNELRF